MKQKCGRRNVSFLYKKKADGSSVYMFIPIVFLFIWILMYVNIYMRATDTVSDNYNTSIDAANLTITVANSDVLLHKGRLGIVALSSDGSVTDMNSAEKEKVGKLFESYERSLQSNVGLNDSFQFSGGTCGWAANFISSDSAVIDTFLIYDVAPDDTIYVYEISDVKGYLSAKKAEDKVTKRVAGHITRDSAKKITGSSARTPENTLITDCTVYSKVSFPVKTPGIANLGYVKEEDIDADAKDFMDSKMRVSSSATTSLKSSTAFEDLNGNGWFR